MKVQLRGHNFELTEANNQYAIDKVSNLERFFGNEEINGVVTVKKLSRSIKVEVMLFGSNKLRIRAEEVTEDFYAAVDIVIEKLEKQIRKHKTKIQKHHQVTLKHNDIVEFKSDDIDVHSEKVVREKEIEIIKPMSLEEAMLQIEMLGHNFFVFKEETDMKVKILYKRNDGNYGLLKADL